MIYVINSARYAMARLSYACRLIHSLDSRARIILFGERIEQADQIYRLLSAQYPGQAGCCHSGLGKQARRNRVGPVPERRDTNTGQLPGIR